MKKKNPIQEDCHQKDLKSSRPIFDSGILRVRTVQHILITISVTE